MAGKSKIAFTVGVALVGGILILTIGAFRGKVVREASINVGGPIVKVREMQADPVSLTGLFGIGETLYRAEYYPRNGARMTACISLEGESQYAGKKVQVDWLTASVCEVKVDGMLVFRWSGNEWRRL